jgi:hypothetical protein
MFFMTHPFILTVPIDNAARLYGAWQSHSSGVQTEKNPAARLGCSAVKFFSASITAWADVQCADQFGGDLSEKP